MSGSNAQWGPSAHIHRVPVIALSQHIYAVIEAFRNIVFRAYGDDRMKDTNDGILSLMEISIAIIGGDIEASVRELLDTLKNNQDNDDDDGSHTEDSDEDEEDETYIIDGCYEQIPEHLRRWALVPHAIQIIFTHLPVVIPTLLEVCLEVTFEAGSRQDTLVILRHLLSHAVTIRDGVAPISSPHHAHYLVGLLRKLSSASKPLTRSWTEFEFTQELRTCVARITTSSQDAFWRSRAVQGLFLTLSDPLSQLELITGLAVDHAGSPARQKQSCSWLEAFLRTSSQQSQSLEPPQMSDLGFMLSEVIRRLSQQVLGAPSKPHERQIHSTVVSLGTFALSLLATTESAMDGASTKGLCQVLHQMSPHSTPASFDLLVSFPPDLSDRTAEEEVELVSSHLAAINKYADALQHAGLVRLEFALLVASREFLKRDASHHVAESVAAVSRLQERLLGVEVECRKVGQWKGWKWDEEAGWVTTSPESHSADRPPADVLGKRRRETEGEDDADSEPFQRWERNSGHRGGRMASRSRDEQSLDVANAAQWSANTHVAAVSERYSSPDPLAPTQYLSAASHRHPDTASLVCKFPRDEAPSFPADADDTDAGREDVVSVSRSGEVPPDELDRKAPPLLRIAPFNERPTRLARALSRLPSYNQPGS